MVANQSDVEFLTPEVERRLRGQIPLYGVYSRRLHPCALKPVANASRSSLQHINSPAANPLLGETLFLHYRLRQCHRTNRRALLRLGDDSLEDG